MSPSSRGTDPLLIYINVSILALPSIKTVDLQFTADYYINMRWWVVIALMVMVRKMVMSPSPLGMIVACCSKI